jgi:hypothetical protein
MLIRSYALQGKMDVEAANSIDAPTDCKVELFRRYEFQGEPLVLEMSQGDLRIEARSLRVKGQCSWKFYSARNFGGKSFEVSAWEMLPRPSTWGWRSGTGFTNISTIFLSFF